jgi:hypothetical protein
MAWSPARRANAGVDGVGQPGDYATLNSNPPRDGTLAGLLAGTATAQAGETMIFKDGAPKAAELAPMRFT